VQEKKAVYTDKQGGDRRQAKLKSMMKKFSRVLEEQFCGKRWGLGPTSQGEGGLVLKVQITSQAASFFKVRRRSRPRKRRKSNYRGNKEEEREKLPHISPLTLSKNEEKLYG